MKIETRVEGWRHQRDLLVDGKRVSWLRVQDYQMRIGSALVSMGGIAAVGTDAGERMKGYSRALMADSVTYMTDEGFHVSLLFGIRNYYHRFGYAVCMPFVKHNITTRDAEGAGHNDAGFRIREYRDEDAESLLALYESSNRERTCTFVRPKELFEGITKGSTWGRRASTIVVEDATGKFTGYAAFDQADEEVVVTEANAWNPAAFPALLQHFAQMAIDKRCGELTLLLPHDHLFTELLRRSECRTLVDYPKCSGGMMRIINQDNLFLNLQEEMKRRLSESSLRDTKVRIGLRTELGDTLLDISEGQVTVVPGETCESRLEMPQCKLSQLVAGYRSIGSLSAEGDVILNGDVLEIIETLFPTGYPYVWVGDYF